MAGQPQPAGRGEARKAPTEPVWREAEVPLSKGDDQIDIVCVGELLQHEGVSREKEAEATGKAGAPQHRPKLGSHKRGWGAHPREVEGIQMRSKHQERINERAPRAAQRDLLC